MSVYVDRLPDECYCCVCNDDNWRCGINGESISHDSRREDCPLIEIVHCEDCQYWVVEYEDKTTGFVAHFCSHDRSMVEASADDFCSYGKRKLKNPDDSLVSEDSEDVKEQESKLDTDIISRQAAIEAVEKAVFKGVAKSAIESLPPVELKRLPQPHKCVVYRDGGECRYPIEDCSECPKHEGMRAVLAESLLAEIIEAGKLYDRAEYSIQDISNTANQWLVDMRDWLNDIDYLPKPYKAESEEV